MSNINQIQRAAHAWPVLCETAANKSGITYGELGRRIDIHHRAIRYVLGVIQDYCLVQHLPPITILVGDAAGIPGTGFIAWDANNLEEGKEQVYSFNWKALKNPFLFAIDGDSEQSIFDKLLQNPEESEHIYARVQGRGMAQRIFRKALLIAYDSSCTICGLAFENALEAAHIIPWSQANEKERMNVQNGVLLCATHHKLFDSGWLSILEDYTIAYADPNEEEGLYAEYDKLMTIAFHEKVINLPVQVGHRPK